MPNAVLLRVVYLDLMVLFTGPDQVVSSIRQEVTGKGGVWNSGIVFQKLIIIMLTFTLQL